MIVTESSDEEALEDKTRLADKTQGLDQSMKFLGIMWIGIR